MRRAGATAALTLLALLVAAWPARATEWRVGRSPEVFHSAEDDIATRIGGWLDASYEDNDLDRSTHSINANHVNVFADTRFRSWQLFVEGEFEHESNLTGYEEEREYELEQSYLRYSFSDALAVRVGQFNTPFGFWTPIHWTILMDTIRAPLHEQQRLTPEQQKGIGITGRVFEPISVWPDLELRYSAHASYGNDSALLEDLHSDGWSVGGDLRGGVREEHFLGISYYLQKRDLVRDRSERTFVLYGQTLLTPELTIRGEYVRQLRDSNTAPGLSRNINITYVKARWSFHRKAYLNYRFNWGDDDSTGIAFQRRVHTVTLGIQPLSWLRIKAEYADHDFDDIPRRDFRYWGLSVGMHF